MTLRPLWDFLQQPSTMAFYTEAAYLVLASLLGGFVGAQREATNHSAGLRTHVLVCLGACLLTRIHFTTGDPGRIAAQVVTGIGFLGAGVILRRGLSVRGLTTAASIWIVAAIGISCGAGGLYAASAAFATLLVLFTLTVGRWSENLIHKNENQSTLAVTITRHKGAVAAALTAITEAGATVAAFETEDMPDGQRVLQVTLRMRPDVKQQDVCDELSRALPDATIEWV
ncbi:MgtC/SapB family protein [Armatimonas sp.]|uniref:MgtC/SapB family protein n=1 Tax=Armatimonas sp. TaxID=1872638 RepID=UPI00286A0E1D|nr:MgtC/SapB family protein [Armatimonas sp.]